MKSHLLDLLLIKPLFIVIIIIIIIIIIITIIIIIIIIIFYHKRNVLVFGKSSGIRKLPTTWNAVRFRLDV